jgi:hypothetical protein
VFGKDVVCRGDVRIRVPDGETRHFPDNSVLEHE